MTPIYIDGWSVYYVEPHLGAEAELVNQKSQPQRSALRLHQGEPISAEQLEQGGPELELALAA